jgi:hypothetical protein
MSGCQSATVSAAAGWAMTSAVASATNLHQRSQKGVTLPITSLTGVGPKWQPSKN